MTRSGSSMARGAASGHIHPAHVTPRYVKLRHVLAVTLACVLAVQPALAQSVLRDAETEAFFRDAFHPIINAAKLDPASVQFLLVGDPSINAFAADGQNVFIFSGLIEQSDNANQIQGVVAHELGHVANGDIINSDEALKGAGRISILSLLIGVAAIAAGAGEAGAGILGAGQQAAQGKYLAFSRDQEGKADQSGFNFMEAAGLSDQGSIDVFHKLLGEEYRLAIPQNDPYVRDHPLTGDRIQALQDQVDQSRFKDHRTDPELEARFQRVRAKLIGFVDEPKRVFQLYPPSDTSIPAHYARAYAYHKLAYTDKAVAETDALLKAAPLDPYFNEVKGQVLLESGDPKAAIPPLRLAFQRTQSPLIAALLGHALISTDNPKDTAEAKSILRTAVARDNQNPFAWYQLGVVYERAGDEPRAALAMAEQANLSGEPGRALTSARHAMEGLPVGSSDWLRAQDIVMVSTPVGKHGKKAKS